MSRYDPTVVVGSGTRGGGGGPRPTVVKNNAQRNQAARQGNLTTTKKVYGTANGSVSAVMNGQRAAAVDRADGPIPTPKSEKDEQIQWNLHILTTHLGITHDQLAKTANVPKNELFKPSNAAPSWKAKEAYLRAVEGTFAWSIRQGSYGPKGACKTYPRGLEYQAKIKEEWDGEQPLLPGKKPQKH